MTMIGIQKLTILFEENCSVLYRLDKTKYTDQDMKYLRRRLEELSVKLSQVSDE